MNIIEFFSAHLTEEAKDISTISSYKYAANDFYKWMESEEAVFQAQPIDIKKYITHLRHEKRLSPATINKYIAALNSLYYYIEGTQKLKFNPMAHVQRISIFDGLNDKPKWLTSYEQERFLSYATLESNDWLRIRNLAIVDLMLYAGLRVQEVSDLTVGDITIKGKDLKVVIRDGKHGKYAVITLIQKYARNLKKWIQVRDENKKLIHEQSEKLFISERSGSLTPRSIQKFITKYGEFAGMQGITPHRFRHSFCKNLARQDTPIEMIRRLARHEKIETTAIYIDPSVEELVNELRRM